MNSLDITVEQYSYSSPETCSPNNHHELASSTPKKCAGRRIFKETRHPVYRGVRSRNNNKWVCEVRVPNHKTTRIWLGTYPTPEMAARAHDVAALALRGESACLNFADSAWRLPPLLPASNSAKELRRVAMEVAETFAVEEHRRSDSFGVVGDDVLQLKGFCLDDEVPDLSPRFEEHDLNDWLQSMADEPLRTPPHPFVGGSHGNYGTEFCSDEVEEGDAEVSLWSFSI